MPGDRKYDILNNRLRGTSALERRVAPSPEALMTETVVGGQKPEPETRIVEVLPENAIVRRDDGAMVYKRFVMWPVGMEIPEDCDKNEWLDVGRVVRDMNNAAAWWVGDWAEYANKNLDMTYGEIAELFSYEPSTVQTYASICRNIHGLIRNQAVSISHCSKIASMEEPWQSHWISYVVPRDTLTVSQLAEDIACLKRAPEREWVEWFNWAWHNPDRRFADEDELKPPAILVPALPVAVTEGREPAMKRLKALDAMVQGKKKLDREVIQREGRALIEWVQWLMEASE